jgi:hypothetical protein
MPDPKTEQDLIQLSHKVDREIGSTFTLNKTSALPHLTLYLAGFPPPNVPQILVRLSQFCSTHNEVCVQIKGWVITGDGLIMLKCVLTKELAALHEDVISKLNDLREHTVADVWLKSLPGLNKKQADILEQVGFPYALQLWSPHFSIAKINPYLTDKVEPIISEFNPSFVGRTVALGLSGEGGIYKSLLLSYKLRSIKSVSL